MFGNCLIALFGIAVHPDLFGVGLRLVSLVLGSCSCVWRCIWLILLVICFWAHPGIFGVWIILLCLVATFGCTWLRQYLVYEVDAAVFGMWLLFHAVQRYTDEVLMLHSVCVSASGPGKMYCSLSHIEHASPINSQKSPK